jgi:hypothetical protein
MMPTLQRNAMSFNLPLANNVGYKTFEATSDSCFKTAAASIPRTGFRGFPKPEYDQSPP